VWNFYTRDGAQGGWLTGGSVANLAEVSGADTGAGLTVTNAPGAWGNGSTDPMYATYLYPFDGGDIRLTVTNLSAGVYDFYLYGHGDADNQNSLFSLSVAGQNYGTLANTTSSNWNSAIWQEGVQYVRFSGVSVGAGQTVGISVAPGVGGYAVLAGMQIAADTNFVAAAPAVTNQPASQTVGVGANVTLTAGVSGSHPLSFQWFFNSNTLAGATSATLTLGNIQLAQAGTYALTVSNTVGATVSSNAVITVVPAANAQTVTLVENTSLGITLTGSASGADSLTFTIVQPPTNGTLSGTAPALTYTPNADYAGSDSFTFQVSDGQNPSAPATVSINVLPESSGPLIDIAFGAGTQTAKVGFAALGQTTNDFWNLYSRDDGHGGWRTFGLLTNIQFVNQIASSAVLTVSNAPGCWGNGSSDPMYATYIYPFDGGNITVTLINLDAGVYDFLIYGHAASDDGNSTYHVDVDGQSYGDRTTTGPGWGALAWAENVQYVRFPTVQLNSGSVVTITVRPGGSGYAILSGLQIERDLLNTGNSAPTNAPLVAKAQPMLFATVAKATVVAAPQLRVKAYDKGGFAFTFTGEINRQHRIEYTDNPISGVWKPLAIVTPTQAVTTVTDPTSTTATKRYYRVVALPNTQ
jgi:hypothetical protein